MEEAKIRELISQMTLEEKAGLCSGEDFWHLKHIDRLGIPRVQVSDGPHGLRKQDESGGADHLGLNESIPAVCFPAGCAAAASFDPELLEQMGEALGEECQAENISTILGPAMNIKRSPLCGRNFEYYSEDPLLASAIASGLVSGIQSKNVGACPKHFLANSQETRRMSASSNIDERTLREIYLRGFEGVVKSAHPWTMMCSYNRINGVYASENHWSLTEVLRNEWGFDGYVMSDWGAVNERVPGLKAGLDLEMPSSGGERDREIVKAVQNGTLDETVLDEACRRILRIIFRYAENRDESAKFQYRDDHKLAQKVEENCIVLLKNEGDLLPLQKGQKVAVIGTYAQKPRYQGGGSSHIHSWKVTSALDALRGKLDFTYAPGFVDGQDETDAALLQEAVSQAQAADVAVLFAGLPDSFESEGYDRTHLRMPACQDALIEAVAAVQPNTVVVLHNGAPVEMPWLPKVKAVLEAYLGGQAVGGAEAAVLLGDVNPSGRLPETFPQRLEDTPCYLTFAPHGDEVDYREGVFVGYRYYESKHMPVLFPFGFGLSYTTFAYSDLKLSAPQIDDTDTLTVSVCVRNTGDRQGKEVVQLYVAPPKDGRVVRPVRELRAFQKVDLAPGQTVEVQFVLDARAFSYWDTDTHAWRVETGVYTIEIGKNAHDIELLAPVTVRSTAKPKPFTRNSTAGDILRTPRGQEVLGALLKARMQSRVAGEDSAISEQMQQGMLDAMPLRAMRMLVPDFSEKDLQALLASLNA